MTSIYLEKLIMSGFKSFRKGECVLGDGVIEIAGPNGSGKSNLLDAIRFALGELNMRALRAKGVKDLINEKASHASVTLVFNLCGKRLEIKRAINNEGKIIYKLNGERARRTEILNHLYSIGIDPSFYNIIPQGQVQKIIEMDPPKRRQLIDALSGIAEYEDKKRDAVRELDKVHERLNESTLILKEREAYLHELEQEKIIAEKFLDSREKFNSCRMSIVKMDIDELRTELEAMITKQKELESTINSCEKEIALRDSELRELDNKKRKYALSTEHSNEKDSLQKSLATIDSDIKVAETILEQSAEKDKELKRQHEEAAKELVEVNEGIDECKEQAIAKKKRLDELKKTVEAEGKPKDENKLSSHMSSLQDEIRNIEEKVSGLVEQKTELAGTMGELKNRLRQYDEIIAEGNPQNTSMEDMENIEELIAKKNSIDNEIKKLFEQEKELNNEIPNLDKQILDMKEQVAMMRSVAKSNALTDFANQIKEKIEGVHGFVYELIEYEDLYSEAVSAAGGGRLFHLVVDNIDTAKKIVDALKRNKLGRMTFIPLKELTVYEGKVQLPSGAIGFMRDFVTAKDKYRKVVEFTFGSTVLVKDINVAKELKGKARMATMEGEVVEQTGVMSGGFNRQDSINSVKLQKNESELEGLISQKKDYYQQLESIRRNMNELRKDRTDVDIKLKEFEVVERIGKENAEQRKTKVASLEKDKEELKIRLLDMNNEIEKLEKELKQFGTRKHEVTEQINNLNLESSKGVEREREKGGLLGELGEVKTSIDSLAEKKSMLEARKKSIEKNLGELDRQLKKLEEENKKNQQGMQQKSKEKTEVEKRISEIENELSKRFKDYQKFEKEYEEIANKRGHKIVELDRLKTEFNKLMIRRSSVETKYKDLTAEFDFEQMEKVKAIDLPREELLRMMKEAEAIINEHGSTVNLKAPEVYAERMKGVFESKDKIEKLNLEIESVIKFIEEIEEKKKDIFLETFTKVNDNFRKLFSIIFHDSQGYLELDKPNLPFDSGLHIKVIREQKKRSLEGLSGGEKSMLALLFILSMHSTRTAPFYIFDEADAALDKENSKKFGQLMKELSKSTQIFVITHNDIVLKYADKIIGVTKGPYAHSEVYGIKIEAAAEAIGK